MKKHSLPPLTNMLEPESVDSYEYLLRLRIDRVKASAIEDAEKTVMKSYELLKVLEATTANQIWLKELDEFSVAWSNMKTERLRILNSEVKVKSKKKLNSKS